MHLLSISVVCARAFEPPPQTLLCVCVRTEKTVVLVYTDNAKWMKASGERQWHKRAVNIHYTHSFKFRPEAYS